jgi:hypothetical protein
MTIKIILGCAGSEFDRMTIDVADDDSTKVSQAIHEALTAWVLSPGDTIKIVEREDSCRTRWE